MLFEADFRLFEACTDLGLEILEMTDYLAKCSPRLEKLLSRLTGTVRVDLGEMNLVEDISSKVVLGLMLVLTSRFWKPISDCNVVMGLY